MCSNESLFKWWNLFWTISYQWNVINAMCLSSGIYWTIVWRYNIEKRELNVGNECIVVAILCSSTSCNGGVCTATGSNIVCQCPTGKFGDRCQVILSSIISAESISTFLYFSSVCRYLCHETMFQWWTMRTNGSSISM